MTTVREFVRDAYTPISANSPTVPLQGNDLSKGIQFLNELIQEFSANALLLTVNKTVTYNLVYGVQEVTFGESGFDVNQGRLANVSNAWLLLQGVTYPLTEVQDESFLAAYKYNPLLGLPLFYILFFNENSTTMRIYPGASQGYELNIYGKFQKPLLDSNDTLDDYPAYFKRFLRIALTKELAWYKSRYDAWTANHEREYQIAKREMEAVSPVNVSINSPDENQLNGAYRVRAGI